MGTSAMKTTIDHTTFTITFQRAFGVPREDVFEAWTRPEEITEWWDPTGIPLRSCVVDLRPGGKFRFENDSAHSPPFEGVYQLIEPPAQLVFDAMGALGTVRLEAEGKKTRMTVTIRCMSAEHLEQYLKLGVAVNTDRTLDNLVAHLEKRAA